MDRIHDRDGAACVRRERGASTETASQAPEQERTAQSTCEVGTMSGFALAWWLICAGLVAFGIIKLVTWAWIVGPSWAHECRS